MNCKKIKHILLGVAVVMFFACSGNNASEPHVHGEECEHSHDCKHEHQSQQESFKVAEENGSDHSHTEECNHQH